MRNPCEEMKANCSHFCLLSSTAKDGYQCGCPDGRELVDKSNCGRELQNSYAHHNVDYTPQYFIASPYLLFTRYPNAIQRVSLDGTLYSDVYTDGRNVRALDFDFRYV